MYCRICGKEINDLAVICPYCGVPTNRQPAPVPEKKKPVNGLGIAGFVISLLSIYLGVYFCIVPLIGLVLSAIGLGLKKKYSLNGLAIAGLAISIVVFAFWLIIWSVWIASACVATFFLFPFFI